MEQLTIRQRILFLLLGGIVLVLLWLVESNDPGRAPKRRSSPARA
ncbi:MAG: hypothetical protein ACYDFT_00750 [Thermoplasmata archaeon]